MATRNRTYLLNYAGRDASQGNMVLGAWGTYDTLDPDDAAAIARLEDGTDSFFAGPWDVNEQEAADIKNGALPDWFIPANELPD